MTTSKPSYFAVIPAQVRYSDNLTANAKLIFGEISALCNQHGYCWASNEYFADLYKSSKRSVTGWISQLEKEEFIKVEMEPNKTGTTRKIFLRGIENYSVGGGKEFPEPHEENFHHNNTVNNTVNNTLNIDPFSSSGFSLTWNLWLEERKAKRHKAYTPRGAQGQLTRLHNECNGNEAMAIRAIDYSIDQGYTGVIITKELKHEFATNKVPTNKELADAISNR